MGLQAVFRGWVVWGGWYQFDDFAWISKSINEPFSEIDPFRSYAGHLMPGGLALSWIFARLDPLGFWLQATTLLAMQVTASLGLFRLLKHMFGYRAGILVPLSLYLFAVVNLPSLVWWAAGINALPMQIALFYGLHAHVTYLRTRAFRPAFVAMAWTVFGLVFFEKTLFVFVVYAFVALAYFSDGWAFARVKDILHRYRVGVVLYSTVFGFYTITYATLALNFDPGTANEYPLAPIAGNLIIIAFGTGIVGGPLRWYTHEGFHHTPSPPDLVVFFSWLVIAAVVYTAAKTRANSRRAWVLVAIVLAADVLLVGAARANVVGPSIALEYRYQGEISAITAVALALAFLPLRGAHETVESIADSNFLASRAYVAGATALVAVVSVISSAQFATRWHESDAPRRYFETVAAELKSREEPIHLADAGVPEYILWAVAYPENLQSRMLKMFPQLEFPNVSNRLEMLDDRGRLQPATIEPLRTIEGGLTPDCGHLVGNVPRTVSFDSPVMGGPWWVRIGYFSESGGRARIQLGSRVYERPIDSGLNSLFLQAHGEFDSLTMQTLSRQSKMCTDDITLGIPKPFQKP